MLSCTSIFVINWFRLNFWPFLFVVIVYKYLKNGIKLDTFDYRQKKRIEFIIGHSVAVTTPGQLDFIELFV